MPNKVAWVLFSGEMAKVLGLPVVIAGRSRPAGQLSCDCSGLIVLSTGFAGSVSL